MTSKSGLKVTLLAFVLIGGGATALAASPDTPATDAAARLPVAPAGQAGSAHVNRALPAALRPVFYQALAKDAGATYRVNKNGCAVLPKQALKACFDGNGAHFSGAGSPLALHVAAWGRSGHLAAVPAVKPLIEGNQVNYAHGKLSAWWRVLPVGFEQGFTLAKRPSGNGALTLALATNGPAHQHNGTFGWGKLRYGKLVVTDARGKVVPATLKSQGDRILIAVNDAHAVYPLTVDPLVWIEQKVTASDGAVNDSFGCSVAVSGTTALIGAPYRNNYQGAVYVFSESDGIWTQTAELTASDGAANDIFGYSVAFNGATALVGAAYATINSNYAQGAAYVFSDSGGTWTQTAKLTVSDGAANDDFGYSVALSGTTALVGAFQTAVNGNLYQGAAYVFSDSGGTWAQTAKLTASDGASGDNFGYSAALSGTTALVGAFEATVNGHGYQGAAYFFGQSDLGLAVSAPQTVGQGQNYVSQTIATNNASAASPAVTATVTVPAAASFVSATASQGSCSEDSGVVTCDFGAIDGNAGTATANVTFKATGNVGDTIDNAAGIAKATPPLSASAPTTITAGGACPDDYSEYDGSLNAGQRTHSPIYSAPAGQENAILSGPSGFQLYAVFQNARVGRKIYRIPGNEVHRHTPAGYFTWVVKAGDTGGIYTLCVQHP